MLVLILPATLSGNAGNRKKPPRTLSGVATGGVGELGKADQATAQRDTEPERKRRDRHQFRCRAGGS